jgi:hypothetical protein
LAEQFGNDFDKYLIRELLEQIDLKDANKPSRDRTETFKVQFMNEELKRICAERTDFLTYFDEVRRHSLQTNQILAFPRYFRGRTLKGISQGNLHKTEALLENGLAHRVVPTRISAHRARQTGR